MTDIEMLVAILKADGLDVSPAEAETIALNNADSVSAYIELYNSLKVPDVEADPATVSEKFKSPSAMEVL